MLAGGFEVGRPRPGPGGDKDINSDLVDVATDGGTLTAVCSTVGANVAIRTAAHPGSGTSFAYDGRPWIDIFVDGYDDAESVETPR